MININKNYGNHQKGFSLVELSIVLVIIGIIGFFSIKFISQIGRQTLNEKFKSDLQIADAAIIGFIFANSRLPCPDTIGNDGLENCGGGNNQGWLPVATLGIESSVQKKRGGKIRYGSYRNSNLDILRDTDLSSLKNRYEPLLPNSETSNLSNGLDFCFALKTASLLSANNASQVNIGPFGTNVAYVIADSGIIDANNDGISFDGSNGAGVKFEKPNEPHANNYDDNVKAVGFNELAGRLNCARVLSQTNGAARASFAAYDMWLASTQYKNYRDFHVYYLKISLQIYVSKLATATAALALSVMSTSLAVADAILTSGVSAVVGAAVAAAASIDAVIAETLAVITADGAATSLADGIIQQTEANTALANADTFKNSKLAIVKALDARGLIR